MKDRTRLEKIIAVAAALIVWQLVAVLIEIFQHSSSMFVVTPVVVLKRLFHLCAEMEFWKTIAFTLVRIATGFLAGLFTGVILAVAAGRSRILEVMLWPYMAVVKATPVASFIILCLIWLSSKNLSVFIAFLMVLPIVYTNILQGIKSTDHKLLEMAELFRVNWWKKLYYIYIPQLKPYLLSACSVSIGLSWKAGTAAEVIGIPDGSIGEKLYEAKVYLSTGELFAWTVVIVVISILSEKMFIYVLKSFLSGKERLSHGH